MARTRVLTFDESDGRKASLRQLGSGADTRGRTDGSQMALCRCFFCMMSWSSNRQKHAAAYCLLFRSLHFREKQMGRRHLEEEENNCNGRWKKFSERSRSETWRAMLGKNASSGGGLYLHKTGMFAAMRDGGQDAGAEIGRH